MKPRTRKWLAAGLGLVNGALVTLLFVDLSGLSLEWRAALWGLLSAAPVLSVWLILRAPCPHEKERKVGRCGDVRDGGYWVRVRGFRPPEIVFITVESVKLRCTRCGHVRLFRARTPAELARVMEGMGWMPMSAPGELDGPGQLPPPEQREDTEGGTL